MNVLVTGSEGRIGRHMVGRLQALGHTVRGFDQKDATPTDYEYTQADLRDFEKVLKLSEGMDAVVHTGAIPSDSDGHEDEVLASNAQGTWNVLLACVKQDIGRVVHFSSVNALGVVGGLRTPAQFPVPDNYPRHPLTPYQIGKHLAEEACRAFSDRWGIVTVSLRPQWVLSQEMRQSWRDKSVGERRPGRRGSLGEWVALEDVGDATLAGLTVKGVKHDAFLLSATTTLWDVPTADVVRENFPTVPWPRASLDDWTQGNPHRALFDCSHAEDVLGWRPKIEWRTE